MSFIQNQYRELLLQLLPQGLAWDKSEGSNLYLIMNSIAKTFADVHNFEVEIPKDLNPLFTTHFLDEWEETLATRKDCKEIDNTFQGRKNAVIAKLRSVGGCSINYFEGIARALGYPVTITDGFTPFKVGRNKVGDKLNGSGWASTFQVRGPAQVSRYFKVGQSKVGEPLAIHGSELLECTINRIKQAQTTALFVYYTVTQALAAVASLGLSTSANLHLTRHLVSDDNNASCDASIIDLWKPSNLSNLALWLNAKDFDSNAAIASWEDRSGNDNDAFQANSSNQPTSVLNTLNSRPVARFGAGDQLEVIFDNDLEVTKNLDIFVAGSFSSGGQFINRTQYAAQIASTVQSNALTKSWHARTFGTSVLGFAGSFCVRFLGNLYLGTWTGLFKSTNNGTSWTEVLDGTDHVYCRGMYGGFIIHNDVLYIGSGTVKKVYKYDGTTVTAYDLTSIAQAGASIDTFTVYGGYVHVGDTAHRRVFKFNGTSWSSIGDAGSNNGLFTLAADATYLYAAIQAGGSSDIYKWDGSSWTAMSTGILNPRVLFVAQGALWVVASGKIYNSVAGWSNPITLTYGGIYYPQTYCFVDNGASVFILDGESGTASIRYDFNGTTLSLGLIKGFLEGVKGDGSCFYDYDADSNEILIGAYGRLMPYRVARESLISYGTGIPSLGIFHFSFYDNRMNIRVNGALVAELRFDLAIDAEVGNEDYRTERILQETIDITSGLVTTVGNIVTITPTSDFPENSQIEVEIDNGAIEFWGGIDDWNFKTGVSV